MRGTIVGVDFQKVVEDGVAQSQVASVLARAVVQPCIRMTVPAGPSAQKRKAVSHLRPRMCLMVRWAAALTGIECYRVLAYGIHLRLEICRLIRPSHQPAEAGRHWQARAGRGVGVLPVEVRVHSPM